MDKTSSCEISRWTRTETHAHLVVKFSGCKLIAVGSLVVAVVTACRFTRYNESKTWEQANQTCTCKGMQLATIRDCEFYFKDTLCCDRSAGAPGNQKYWVGARAGTIDDNRVQLNWIDGTENTCSVTNMTDADYPCKNITCGQCVYVQKSGGRKLRGSDCSSPRGFLCESPMTGGKCKTRSKTD